MDLDGVQVNYEEGLRDFLMAKTGRPRSDFPKLTDYSAIKSGWPIKDREDFIALHAEAVDNGLYTKLNAIPGMPEMVQRLARDGYIIHVITSRFVRSGQHAEVVRQTAISLDKINMPYHEMTFTSRKKEVEADVYLDDAPENIDSLRGVDKNVIVYSQNYNEGYPDRYSNPEEIERRIREMAPLD
jgi:5'-nucleotidase